MQTVHLFLECIMHQPIFLFVVSHCPFRPAVCDPYRRHCFSGAGAAGITSCQLYTMVVPESQDQAPSGSVGRGTSQQYGSSPSSSQHFGSPQHFSSNGNISPVNTSPQYEPQEYTETDYLLPNQLYGRSSLSRSIRAKDAGGSGAPAETVCSMVLQILVPFLLAGLGTVSAGMLLEVVQVRKQSEAELDK